MLTNMTPFPTGFRKTPLSSPTWAVNTEWA
jgi:hypothetical protein